jgi:CheY-like chemotaxis protein
MTTTHPGTGTVGQRDVRPMGQEGRRLLLVDSDPTFPRLLQAWLAGRGWRVDLEDSGRRALAHATALSPTLVLAGLDPGGLDVFEFIAQLRRVVPGVPVVLCAPHAAVGSWDRETLAALGIARALVRPVRFLELERELLRLLEPVSGTASSAESDPATMRDDGSPRC